MDLNGMFARHFTRYPEADAFSFFLFEIPSSNT